MSVSVFDLFTIGIGPSSSHTVGPMRAANRFACALESQEILTQSQKIHVQLFGSLGATGRGHGTAKAILGGLRGWLPEVVDPQELIDFETSVIEGQELLLLGKRVVEFDCSCDIDFSSKLLEFHSNAMRFSAFDKQGKELLQRTYYSVGGGSVVEGEGTANGQEVGTVPVVPYPFDTCDELLEQCRANGLSISSLMLANETANQSEPNVRSKLLAIWNVMVECVNRGCQQEGILPGGLKVKRRAAPMYRRLKCSPDDGGFSKSMNWVNLWALAVNEENAAGGRVVTAPTNGAAGIIPAVLHYFHEFRSKRLDEQSREDATVRFLLTAAAIGTLFKKNASISGAEVGCQGEVGSACSMAAGGLCEVLGGTPEQVENAAEIGMEHNLGLTCDPIGGLVQVPCIERNAMGAVKAINSAQLALQGDGRHFVSLDKVIRTMRDTGRDMKTKYKETARGGLAVNVIEC